MVAAVKPSFLEAVRETLAEIGADPARNELLPFGRLTGVHFARLFLMEPTNDLQGRPIPAELVFMADWDAPLAARLEELAAVGQVGLEKLFSACEGYPGGGAAAVADFLRRNAAPDATYYVNTVGLSADQVLEEGTLRDDLEQHLDTSEGLRKRSATELRAAFVDWVEMSSERAWATQAPALPSLAWRLGELAHLVLLPLLGLLLLPVILVLLPFWLIALRVHEAGDPAPDALPDADHLAELEALEDHGPINPFTAAGFIKPGWFRTATAKIVLFLIAFGVRHLFNRANLAGVKTIHFARWTMLDGGRRVIFTSNYDGSLESYMDDFIDKLAWGLNAVFSNGFGYPPTRFLLFGGARHARQFKHYLRVHQVPTPVWYTPYPNLSAHNIANNSAVRAGLRGELPPSEAAAWLTRL